MPEEVRNASVIKRLATPEDAARSLIEHDRMSGRMLLLPTAEPGTEDHTKEMQAIYNKMGRPEKAEDYAFTLPEGREMDEQASKQWKTTFHGLGLSQTQAQGMLDEFFRGVKAGENLRDARVEQSRVEGLKQLYAEFGATAEERTAKAKMAVSHVRAGYFNGQGGARAVDLIASARLDDGSMLLNQPEVVEALASIQDRLFEGELKEGDTVVLGRETESALWTRLEALQPKRLTGSLNAAEASELASIVRKLSDQQVRRGERVA